MVFYSILRQLVATSLKIYFRKIYLLHADRVPSHGPLIIAANHPMAFCDACLLACFLDRPLHFLVRGDVFVKRWLWFFRMTNQIPIYRFRDGFGNMRKNADSFEHVHRELAQGAAVLIFAEGNTHLRKHLAPLQKGPIRIALGAMESGAQDLRIVPVGINYSDGRSFRSDVFLSVGEPFDLAAPAQISDKKSYVAEQTKQLYDRLLPHVIHCADEKVEAKHSMIAKKKPHACYWPVLDVGTERFEWESRLAKQLNEDLTLEINDDSVVKRPKTSLLDHWLSILLVPLGFLGIVLNAIPFYVAKSVAAKRVKLIEFYTPVRIGLTMILEMLWLVLLLILGWILVGPAALVLVALVPLLGYLGILVYEEWRSES